MNKYLQTIQDGNSQTTCSTAEAFAAIADGATVIHLVNEATAADLWKESERQPEVLEAQVSAPANYAKMHLGYSDEVHTVDGLHLHRVDFTCRVTGRCCRAIAISSKWSNGEIHEEPFAVLTDPDTVGDDGPTAWGIDLQNKMHKALLHENEKRLTNLGKRAVTALNSRLAGPPTA